METNIQVFDFYTLLTVGILAMVVFALGLVLIFYTSQRKLLQEKMRQQRLEIEHQEGLLYASIKTQEQERVRIAKDLHDEIGSKLNVIFMNLHSLRKETKSLPTAATAIQDIKGLLNTTIDTTRRISHDLLPPTLNDFGLAAALRELRDTYQASELNLELDTSNANERLEDKLIELNLFRVLQELIKNSVVHGNAKNIHLQISTNPPNFSIHYQDDGVGFEVEKLEERKGLGTQNIESRLKMCNADIIYDSAIGKGVKVNITSKTASDQS
ncbi:MAG: histidine kinase [Bacteroidota bacterium]